MSKHEYDRRELDYQMFRSDNFVHYSLLEKAFVRQGPGGHILEVLR